MEEIWKPIVQYEYYKGLYEVSNKGRVRSLDRVDSMGRLWKGKIISAKDNGKGYKAVHLYKNSKNKQVYLHRLVAHAFVPNPENKPDVNHEDGNKSNNTPENLKWTTKKENIRHAVENGLIKTGGSSKNAKLTDEDVEYIRANYIPFSKDFNATVLSEKFNVSYTQIVKVARGKRRSKNPAGK